MSNPFACDYCGWNDTDPGYFTEVKGKFYCSLHIPGKMTETTLCGDHLITIGECGCKL